MFDDQRQKRAAFLPKLLRLRMRAAAQILVCRSSEATNRKKIAKDR
jgi:hypothetical protein